MATLLLTTQYLDEADQLADRIAVIDHGRVIAEGTAASLKAQTGGARLEVNLTRPHTGAATALVPFVDGRSPSAWTAGASGPAYPAHPASPPPSSGPSTRPASPSTTSQCTSPRSTTCSSLTGQPSDTGRKVAAP